MNNLNVLGKRFALGSVVVMGALMFSAEKANAGFFDKINEALDSVTTEVDKAKGEIDSAQAKLDETKAQVDETASKLDAAKAQMDATKEKGEKMVGDMKGLASISDDE